MKEVKRVWKVVLWTIVFFFNLIKRGHYVHVINWFGLERLDILLTYNKRNQMIWFSPNVKCPFQLLCSLFSSCQSVICWREEIQKR